MKLLARDGDSVTYEARFWEAPVEAGQNGRYVVRKLHDRIVPRYKSECVGGVWRLRKVGDKLLNTARNVSYYQALEKALGIKWGEA